MADTLLTSPAKYAKFLMVIFTLVLFIFFMFGETAELKSIKLLCDFFSPTTVYQFSQLEWSTAMRTLSSLLCQPAPNAAEATKLRAMRTQACIPQFLHTNETSENLSNALHALFIHRLRLSTGPAETRGVRGLTC